MVIFISLSPFFLPVDSIVVSGETNVVGSAERPAEPLALANDFFFPAIFELLAEASFVEKIRSSITFTRSN